MYFKTFALGASTENHMKRAGFQVNSHQEIKTFQGSTEESTILRPKDYCFDGSLWEEISVPFTDRIILLGRMPIPSFGKLWDLCFNGDKEDQFGALTIISSQYASEMIYEIQSTVSISNNKIYRKKLLRLKENPILNSCFKYEQIVSAIDNVLME